MKYARVTIASLLLAANAAHAHTHLESSTPLNGSKVAPPTAIELRFSAAARVTALTLQPTGGAARGLTPLPAKATNVVNVPVSGLAAGSYTVTWRVAGEDGHVMSGSFQFTVDPTAPAAAAPAPGGHAH